MRCVNPRRLPNPYPRNLPYDAYINVSCGKCYACLANRRRQWLFRLMNENLNSSLTVFLTLTYDPELIPLDQCVKKSHLQKFFKKLRHFYDFKYYAIGEYGTNTHRPHYHAVLFIKNPGVFLDDVLWSIDDCWSMGFVAVSRATYRRLNYVLHYHVRPKVVDNRPTFSVMSKGLGLGFINADYLNYIMSSNSSVIHDYNGNIYVVPRYYRKKLRDMLVSTDNGIFKFDDTFVNSYKRLDDDFFKVYGKHMYQLSGDVIANYLHARVDADTRKLNKYNNQDKYL